MKTTEIYIDKLKTNITFCIGENAQDNFDLIDASSESDLWFHLNHLSSSHVVARVPEGLNRKERGYIIRKGAEICKISHSKSKTQKKLIDILGNNNWDEVTKLFQNISIQWKKRKKLDAYMASLGVFIEKLNICSLNEYLKEKGEKIKDNFPNFPNISTPKYPP